MDLLGRAALATAIKNKLKASAWADIVSDYGAKKGGIAKWPVDSLKRLQLL